jgi:hypothetical protein
MATTQPTLLTPTPDSVPLSLLPAYSTKTALDSSHQTSQPATFTPAISFARSKILSSFTTSTSSHRPAEQQNASNEDRPTDKLSTGTEVGICFAIAIFVIAIFCGTALIYRKSRVRRKQAATTRVEALQNWDRSQDMEMSLAKQRPLPSVGSSYGLVS